MLKSSREGKLSDVLAPVLAFVSFESGARDGVLVRMMESFASSGTREFPFICWRLGQELFDILCFSVSSKQLSVS